MKVFKQQGIALVTALLIISISTIVAAQIFYKQQINLRRTFNQIQGDQVYQLFLSSEQWAKIILLEDLENTSDTFLDIWAQEMPPIEAEGGLFQARIIDYQSCFNLNNLVISGAAQDSQIKIFKALLRVKSTADMPLNENLIWNLVDWLDTDDEPKAQGSEWETYSQLIPPYRAANQALTEIGELYAVNEWNAEVVNALADDICALPSPPAYSEVGRYFPAQTTAIPLNINTISPILLSALSDKMPSAAELTQFIQLQHEEGFKSAQEFFDKLDELYPQEPKLSSTLPKALLDIKSSYFMLHYTGWIGNLEQQYKSLFYRDTKKIETLYRSRAY